MKPTKPTKPTRLTIPTLTSALKRTSRTKREQIDAGFPTARDAVLEYLTSHGKGSVPDIAADLRANITTIRHAIRSLSMMGQIRSIGEVPTTTLGSPAKIWKVIGPDDDVSWPAPKSAQSIIAEAMKSRTPLELAWGGLRAD